ncbi:chaplin [Streptomyces marispadix]|uniref:Chaplin n=1 Tax=Streptomyces marispadix TaxID=2922868 RepID=A0ABS9SZ05_9ACTN|nr:chaplin [Streptomyces marispadix]MCH6161502.1 chaplin [Streptomyces marispadix]
MRVRNVLVATAFAAAAVVGGAGAAAADSPIATGSANQPSGVLSGNVVQVPINAPINACGNTADVIGVQNPAVGNACQAR